MNTSHRQRAEQALAIAGRRVARLEAQKAKHQAKATEIDRDLVDATRHRDYLAKSPYLPSQPVAGPPAEETP